MAERLSLLVLFTLLAACGPMPGSGVPVFSGIPVVSGGPEGYAEAVAAGDADAALATLREAADSGDLLAHAALADAFSRGYLTAPADMEAAHLPLQVYPWSAAVARAGFRRAVSARAETGDPDALFFVAEGMLVKQRVRGEWQTPEAHRDSALAIYRTLVATDAHPTRLAFLAQRLDDEPAFLAHLRDAAGEGDEQACLILHWETRDRTVTSVAADVAASIDATEACRASADAPRLPSYAEDLVGDLAAQIEGGNVHAVALADSLDALGVFERHPHLTAALPAR